MKSILILAVGLAASCGKVEVINDKNFNSYNSLSAKNMPLGSAEHTRIKAMCEAIRIKTETLPALLNTSYVFAGTTKDCKDDEFKNLGDSTVTLINDNGAFKFGQLSSLFYFDEVETVSDGVLSQVCSKLTSLSSPIIVDETNLLYFSTEGITSSDCISSALESCIKIERATKEVSSTGVEQARVHTREWIRIRLDTPRRGFFTYKKKASVGDCDKGLFSGRTATLK